MDTRKSREMPVGEVNAETSNPMPITAPSMNSAQASMQALEPEMIAYLQEQEGRMTRQNALKTSEMPKKEMNERAPESQMAPMQTTHQGRMPTREMNE